MRATVLLTPLLWLAVAGAVPAAETYPCRADVERFCPDVQPGEGRVRACVRSHLPRLSSACRAHLELPARRLRGENAPRMVLACKEDLETLCRNVPVGDGRWRRCLDDHADRLSGPCRELLGLAQR